MLPQEVKKLDNEKKPNFREIYLNRLKFIAFWIFEKFVNIRGKIRFK